MKTNIFILNGRPRSGKDTVAEIVKEKYPTTIHSTIDTVKEIYRLCGWDGEKRPEDRKRLSDVKDFLTERFDLPYKECCEVVEEHIKNNVPKSFLFLMIREPEEIRRMKDTYPFIHTVLVDAGSRLGSNEESNHADANVCKFNYDIVIDNSKDLNWLHGEIENKIIIADNLFYNDQFLIINQKKQTEEKFMLVEMYPEELLELRNQIDITLENRGKCF